MEHGKKPSLHLRVYSMLGKYFLYSLEHAESRFECHTCAVWKEIVLLYTRYVRCHPHLYLFKMIYCRTHYIAHHRQIKQQYGIDEITPWVVYKSSKQVFCDRLKRAIRTKMSQYSTALEYETSRSMFWYHTGQNLDGN